MIKNIAMGLACLACAVFCIMMIMVSVLTFEETRDRIYTDINHRVSVLEGIIKKYDKSFDNALIQ